MTQPGPSGRRLQPLICRGTCGNVTAGELSVPPGKFDKGFKTRGKEAGGRKSADRQYNRISCFSSGNQAKNNTLRFDSSSPGCRSGARPGLPQHPGTGTAPMSGNCTHDQRWHPLSHPRHQGPPNPQVWVHPTPEFRVHPTPEFPKQRGSCKTPTACVGSLCCRISLEEKK